MKVQVYKVDEPNSGKVIPEKDRFIKIKRGRYIINDTSHPLISREENCYNRVYSLEYKNRRIYFLNRFGSQDGKSGFHIGLSWGENQRFLLMQKAHWFQQEGNIRYLVNVIFLFIGAYISLKSLNSIL